ncbi:MAG: hypothetical protein K9N21_02140 [Deltaproteobacteria bacterium]|nr:hypothetical protein [Deltaproteobacteria bacterium]
MKRVLFGLISVLTLVCFSSLVPSNAADNPKIVFGEEKHGLDDNTPARNFGRSAEGTVGLNYSKENYTALAPSAGESYNQSATRIFYPGDTIYFVDRYRIATAGTYTRYYFITDVVGTTLAVYTKTFTIDTPGHYWGTQTATFYELGSYVYSSLTLGPGEWISSQQFSFIVE